MNTKDIGNIGETVAAKFLRKNGYRIIKQNVHISHNELDIIAVHKKDGIIAFVEVKARTVDEDLYSKFGSPATSVTKAKQQRTVSAARAYLNENPKLAKFQPRLDIIEVYLKKDKLDILKINHIENAFGV